MTQPSGLREILIEHHFSLIFERAGETNPEKQKYWREELRESVEKDVDKMLHEEFELIFKNKKTEPKSIIEKTTWTFLQVVGNTILAYSINQQDIIMIVCSIMVLMVTTIWFWILNN